MLNQPEELKGRLKARLTTVQDRDILGECIKTIAKNGGWVLDVGGHSPYRKSLSDFRPLLEKTNYICLDIAFNPKLSLQADALCLPFRDRSVDSVIIFAVLQHVFDPLRVMEEIYRVLKPGGRLFGYVPFLYPYHGAADHRYPDCWRLTKDGLLYALRQFESVTLQPVCGYVGTVLSFLTVFRLRSRLAKLEWVLGKLMSRIRRKSLNPLHNTTGFQFFAVKTAEEERT